MSDGLAPIERLRRICLALPEVTEKIAWGEPTFRVGGKLFAQVDDHHHGADHLAVWLAMPLGAQEGLVYADARQFFIPPYVGRRGWIGVRLDRRPNWTSIEDLVRDAYRCIAPKRLAQAQPAAISSSGGERASRRMPRSARISSSKPRRHSPKSTR